MNEEELDILIDEIEKFLKNEQKELDFDFTYEGNYEEDMKTDELNFVITTKNTPSGLLRLVLLRNKLLNSDEFSVYEFIEEQVGDQMADGDEYLVVDFYIKRFLYGGI